MTTTTPLPPCPFCGTSDNLRVIKVLGRSPQDYDGFKVRCETPLCFAQGPHVTVTSYAGDEAYRALAIAAWADRAGDAS